MTRHTFSEEEIINAPQWLADEMRGINQVDYYLRSCRQFMPIAWAGIVFGFILGFMSGKFALAMACYGLGLAGNLASAYYANKARKILRKSRYKD